MTHTVKPDSVDSTFNERTRSSDAQKVSPGEGATSNTRSFYTVANKRCSVSGPTVRPNDMTNHSADSTTIAHTHTRPAFGLPTRARAHTPARETSARARGGLHTHTLSPRRLRITHPEIVIFQLKHSKRTLPKVTPEGR